MKKTYQIPETVIMTVAVQQMIADSIKIPVSEQEYDGEKPIETRKKFSVWGDDEDYDF